MASIMPKSRFVHMPKTGGCWVEHTLHFCVKGAKSLNNPHPHIPLSEMPGGGLFTFGFSRHPFEWYRSYWAYRMTTGWDAGNGFDRVCGDSIFSYFVEKALENKPGYYSKSLRSYFGPRESTIDFVGKQENLVEDLITALSMANESFDPEKIRIRKPVNVSKAKYKQEAICQDDLKVLLLEAEKEAMERFGYE